MDFMNNGLILETHTEACMTRPDTCSVAGGAVSLWLKESRCTDVNGMITARTVNGTGFNIYCTPHQGFR